MRLPEQSLATTFAVLILILPTIATAESGAQAEPKRMTFVFARPQDHSMTQGLIRVYTEALKRLGIELAYVDVPAKRGVYLLNAGLVDGDLGRLYDYSDSCSNVVRIEEPNNTVRLAVYSAKPDIWLNGWESLKGTKYKVECQRGAMICVDNVSRIVPQDQFSEINTINQGVSRLLIGRTDLFIQTETVMDHFLETKGFTTVHAGQKIYKVGIMVDMSGHGYLHKKHSDLAPRVSGALRQMKSEGIFEELLSGEKK